MTSIKDLVVIGVDPGGTTGIAALTFTNRHLAGPPTLIQSTDQSVAWIVSELLRHGSPAQTILAIEKFIIGPRASRSSHQWAGSQAHGISATISALGDTLAGRVVLRSASEVKPWASNRRLEAAGLLNPRGMPHALDACRHALFAAVKDANIPDPLSKKASAPSQQGGAS